MEDEFCEAALKWLEESGSLANINSALITRAALHKPHRIFSAPIHVNIMDLRHINEGLADLVVNRPMKAQRIFHHVVHVASVAIMLQLKSQVKKEDTESNVVLDEEEHCIPCPAIPLPDPAKHFSLYLDNTTVKKVLNETVDLEITVDKADLDLTLHSLASNLPLESSVIDESSDVLTAPQIYVPLRVSGLSGVTELAVRGIRDLPLKLDEPRLAFISGRILSISISSSYTKWVRYVCSTPGCVGMARDLHVRVFVVGRPEADTVHNHPYCRVCHSSLSEDPSSRELGEKAIILVLPNQQAEENVHVRVQALRVVLRDEMKQGLQPGQALEATVMISPQNFPQFPSLEGILVHPPIPLRPPSSLPPVFSRLVKDRESSPWSLVLTLAYMFAASVTPAGTFHTLKFALLLSLAACSSEKPGLAVLGVGSNTTMLLRLLWWSALHAPRSVVHSSLDAVAGACVKDGEGHLWVEAGSLLRAHGGVCVLGEFSKFKKDLQQSVCRALESGVVQVQHSTRLGKDVTYFTYPLRTTAWGCYDPSTARTQEANDQFDSFLHVPLGDLTKSITDVFGLVVYTETPLGECEREAEDVITLHTLLQATTHQAGFQSSSQSLLPSEQLSQYLNIVRSIKVVFSASAEKLIRGYYVATRRLRGDCVQGSAVPITAIHTMAQVASSHARLALRTTVEGWDAAAAVLLCEEALAAHSGYSLLHITPKPHLPPNTDLHTLVGRKNDERMANFQKTLEVFINTHTGDIPGVL
ncbi:hypothetical protein Pmani_017772 [Petrolisthes manimaculis]|uniref:MCM domain-containing protein n=1 Tax=Petrolisthes manimaculis TaxID=1843537 RepID=A0AAE1PPC6_9EUCA|nr:hypothetical protein Pmani_017772 [Petrolisthes manimaculis]